MKEKDKEVEKNNIRRSEEKERRKTKRESKKERMNGSLNFPREIILAKASKVVHFERRKRLNGKLRQRF